MKGINRNPYHQEKVALGTKHKKELVIAPEFRVQLGATVIVPKEMDTDSLGTFSGEIERHGSPIDVVVKKAEWAMSLTGLPYGLANEGSFGPHPQIGFVPADSEWMVFIDQKRNFKILEYSISTKTNFGHIAVKTAHEAEQFLKEAQFPSHGMIVRPHISAIKDHDLFKGIISKQALEEAVNHCSKKSADGLAQIETDMRAHMNPTRQTEIQSLAKKLSLRLGDMCKSCGTPGWGLIDTVLGLPCEICEEPTQMIKYEKFGCAKCDNTELHERSDGLKTSSAQYCDRCNP